MEEKRITIAEMAVLLDCSVHTIDNWYAWRKKHPEHPMAAMLPDFEKLGKTGARTWKQSDVWKVDAFRKALPKGRKGILGDVTQPSFRKKMEKKRKAKERREKKKLEMRERRATEKENEQNRIEREQEQERIAERIRLANPEVSRSED